MYDRYAAREGSVRVSGAAAMTSFGICLLGVFADVALLLALVAAVVSPRVSHAARPLIATFAFTCAWLLTAAFGALGAQDWMMVIGAAMIAVSIIVIIVTVHLWTREGVDGESGPGPRGDEGGGGPVRHQPDASPDGGGVGELSWWPEFERQLAFYVEEGERESASVPEPRRELVKPVAVCCSSSERVAGK